MITIYATNSIILNRLSNDGINELPNMHTYTKFYYSLDVEKLNVKCNYGFYLAKSKGFIRRPAELPLINEPQNRRARPRFRKYRRKFQEIIGGEGHVTSAIRPD